jgi:hypothetical protein
MRRQVLASAVPLAPADRPLSEVIDLVMADWSALVKSGRPARYARAGLWRSEPYSPFLRGRDHSRV